MDLLDTEPEAPHAIEDLVRGLDPFERSAAVVMRVHVGEDGRAQLRNARVRSAFERFSVRRPKKRSTKLSHDA